MSIYNSINNVKLPLPLITGFILIAILFAMFQAFLIKLTGFEFIPFLFAFIVLTGFIYAFWIKNYYALSLFICIISYAYINDSFNYYLELIILQDIPAILLFGIALLKFLSTGSSFAVRFNFFQRAMIFVFLYSIVMAVVGILKGNAGYFVYYEFFNFSYYLLPIPIAYLLTEKSEYHKLFLTMVFASVILSFQYIFVGLLFSGKARFTSFHAGFFPFFGALFYSALSLIKKNSLLKLGILVVSFIVALGAFSTLTRSVWASIFIALGTVTAILIYQKYRTILEKRKNLLAFTITISLLAGMTLYIWSAISVPKAETMENATKTSQRVESLSNPSGDASLLMRVEIGYYVIMKFIASPVFGDGFGSTVQYQIFGDSELHYPDSSWLYFFWKGGIIGGIILIYFYFAFFKAAYRVLLRTDDITVKVFTLAIIGGYAGFIVYSIFSPHLIKYSKINLLAAVIFAYIDTQATALGVYDEKK